MTTQSRTLVSAGLLMYRRGRDGALELFLVHPGGPFFRNKDAGVWTIPKGLIEPGEGPLDAAQREFHEETGLSPAPPFLPLTPVRQKSGKTVMAWAFAGEADPDRITCNTYIVEWPPRSGRMREFPEVDRAAFFSPRDARIRLNPAQVAFVDELERLLAAARAERSAERGAERDPERDAGRSAESGAGTGAEADAAGGAARVNLPDGRDAEAAASGREASAQDASPDTRMSGRHAPGRGAHDNDR